MGAQDARCGYFDGDTKRDGAFLWQPGGNGVNLPGPVFPDRQDSGSPQPLRCSWLVDRLVCHTSAFALPDQEHAGSR